MKNSKLIALSALATALSVAFMLLGGYVPAFEYSSLFMASMCVMLPLAKKSVKGALMSYFATALLSSIFLIGVQPAMIVFYAMFFGLHPTVNFIVAEKKFNKVAAGLIKTAWFVGALLVIYVAFSAFLTEGTVLEREDVKQYVYLILTVGGAILFVFYDLLMMRFQKFVDSTVARLKL